MCLSKRSVIAKSHQDNANIINQTQTNRMKMTESRPFFHKADQFNRYLFCCRDQTKNIYPKKVYTLRQTLFEKLDGFKFALLAVYHQVGQNSGTWVKTSFSGIRTLETNIKEMHCLDFQIVKSDKISGCCASSIKNIFHSSFRLS